MSCWPMMAAASHEPLGWGMVEEGWRKGPWTAEEDRLLIEYVKLHGEGRWNSVSRLAGLKRNGKSCRLRWVNYLRPDLKRGQITPHEESIIVELHARWGNRWSTIARSLPGRTDNEIKNYWRTHFKKKVKSPNDNNSEKVRARLLKRQQYHQQQQQHHHQQQQQQMHQAQNQILDMKRLMSFLEENEDHVSSAAAAGGGGIIFSDTSNEHQNHHHHQQQQQQGFLYSWINNYGNLPEGINENQEPSWDMLWNMDDFNGNMNSYSMATTAAASRAAAFY